MLPGLFNGGSRIPSLFDDILQGIDNFAPARAVTARGWGGFQLDVTEEDDRYRVKANLPGVDRENIDVSMEKNILTISVKQDREETKEGERYLYRERSSFAQSRSVQLNAGNSQEVDASLKDGVLTIEVKKHEAVKPKKVSIG